MLPKSTIQMKYDYEQKISNQHNIIQQQAKLIRALEQQLQNSMSERLKCLKCRVKLRELRRNDGGTC
jgi:hypothetical protein